MARRRKSASSNKANDAKDNVKSNESINVNQKDGVKDLPHSSPSKEDDSMEVVDSGGNLNTSNENLNTSNENINVSEEHLMPIDIQQMILGTGQSQEFIVSRGSAGEVEFTVEPGNVLEREEEYEVNTEEEDEEEVIYVNEEEDGENQYVIVVNTDDIEVSDDMTEEISIHDLSAIQEGSCEIITVVRESDYDSSQESVDGMEEDCDNINAVIGSVDGIHCIQLSQYQSEDEISNHENDNAECCQKEEVLEQSSAERSPITKLSLEQSSGQSHKSGLDVVPDKLALLNLSEQGDKLEHTMKKQITAQKVEINEHKNDTMTKPNIGLTRPIQEKHQICSNKPSITETKQLVNEPIIGLPVQNKETSIKGLDEPNISLGSQAKEKHKISPNESNISLASQTEKKHKKSLNEPNISLTNSSKRKGKNTPTETSINFTRSTEEIHITGLKVSSQAVGSSKSLDSPTKENKKVGLNDLSKLIDVSKNSESKNTTRLEGKPVESATSNSYPSDLNVGNRGARDATKTPSSVKCNFEQVKEHKLANDLSQRIKSTESFVMEKDSGSGKKLPKEENCTSASTCFDQQKVEMKEELVKKEEDDKQSAFRSRSGSTDTTSSESGSNSGSGIRRSGRIKTIAESKQLETDSSLKSVSTVPLVVPSPATPPVPGFEPDKPVKVKSRWRRTSELEMGTSKRHEPEVASAKPAAESASNSCEAMARPATPPESPPPLANDVLDILFSFQHLDSNDYLTDKSKCKDKRMVCDCVLTKEELARGDMGCGEDCLNRLLMIECGARCTLGERCSNKRFQNLEYAKCEVFKTEMKGFGLRATEDLPEDTFLLEYVGEVLDPKEFRKRAKEYAKDKNRHFYFMALKSDLIIDATQKGNISRFINHSCDPNAETQKWTVNGELRIGFFSKRPVAAGEEITFDYQLQRYGKEAQRCFCKAKSCRGWIGEDPEKENKWSDLSGRGKERKEKEKKKREEKRVPSKDVLSDIDLEEEIDLDRLVLKNRAQTLLLCRLMVRAEEAAARSQLLSVLASGQPACQRLFLDYHGLRLVWSWMMDPGSTSLVKLQILETLAKLPIPNKTMLLDSKVLSVVEKWSTAAQIVSLSKDRSSTEEDSEKADSDKERRLKAENEKSSEDANSAKFGESKEEFEKNKDKIVKLATTLLDEWAPLKEVFRIPKKERIEQMKEHEREADKVFRDGADEKQDKSYDRHRSRNDYDRRDRDRERERDRERDRDRDRDRERDRDRKRGRDSPDSDRSRKSSRFDDSRPSQQLTKLERRQLFAIQAAQDEEERSRQRQQETLWQEQQAAAQAIAAASSNENGYMYPPPPQWMPFPQDPNMMPPLPMEGQTMFPMAPNNPPPFLFSQSGPIQHPPFLDGGHNPPVFHPPPVFNPPPPLPKQPLLPTPPLPGQPFPPLPNQPHLLMPHFTPPLPTQPPPVTVPQFSQPPPFAQPPLPSGPPTPTQPAFQAVTSIPFLPPLPRSSPSPVAPSPTPQPAMAPAPVPTAVPLPPRWKSATDSLGRTYYYHVKLRLSQWIPPIWAEQQQPQQQTVQISDSESDSSDSDEDESSSDEVEPDAEEKVDEETVAETAASVVEVEKDEDLGCKELPEAGVDAEGEGGGDGDGDGDSPYEPETMELLEDIAYDDFSSKQTKGQPHPALVQQRIISPRTADEIPDKIDKKKIRELKEQIRREKAKQKAKEKARIQLKLKTRLKGASKRSSTNKCEADTSSSDAGRKIKDTFLQHMANVIVHYLNAYRKPDCKMGKITCTDDFKHLAKKLNHFVMLKELKHCRSVDELVCNDNVKHKARDFVRKYMAKFGSVYSRPADDD